MLKMHKGIHMRKLVQQRDQEAIWIQIGIDAYAMIWRIGNRMAIVAQHAFAFMSDGKMNGMRLKERSDLLIRSAR